MSENLFVMISQTLNSVLNEQIKLETIASMQYLSMASWSEINGYNGIAKFFYRQAEEEREHMLKLIYFVNERGGEVEFTDLEKPISSFESVYRLFDFFLEKERVVTDHVNKIVYESLQEKDYTVHNFMQWYVSEQAEEEALANSLLDKLKIIGEDKAGLYLFDKDLKGLNPEGDK